MAKELGESQRRGRVFIEPAEIEYKGLWVNGKMFLLRVDYPYYLALTTEKCNVFANDFL